MSNPTVVHWLPNLTSGDAVSNIAFHIARRLQDGNISSKFYCLHWDSHLERGSWEITSPPPSTPERVHIYHYSVGSPLSTAFISASGKKFMVYYNITPSDYFSSFSPLHARICQQGRDGLPKLAGAVEMSFAISEFSASELLAAGYRDVQLLPLAADPNLLSITPDPNVLSAFDPGESVFLYVGRMVPNKRQKDVIKLFAYYHHVINPRSTLALVGSAEGMESYFEYLQAVVKELDVQSRVIFPGKVSREGLVAYYHAADVFVSMSEHEGFGLPLLETMAFDVPVVAYASTAVPEVMGGAGVLFREKNDPILAELIHLLIEDAELQKRVIQGQRRRWEQNAKTDLGHNLITHLMDGMSQNDGL